MTAARLALGGLGLAAGAYGAVLMLGMAGADLLSVTLWLAAGVVVHDAVVAPLTVAAVLLGRRVLAPAWRTPVTVGAVVLLTVTATAVPVLGRFGAREDNPTLLDRDYTTGYAVLVALVVLGVGLGALWLRRRSGPEDLSRALDEPAGPAGGDTPGR